jgi:hypothetical protein
MKASILVTHQRQQIALVNARHTTLLGPAAQLPAGHARLRHLMHMTHYAQLIARGQLPGHYRDEDAEQFARQALRRIPPFSP